MALSLPCGDTCSAGLVYEHPLIAVAALEVSGTAPLAEFVAVDVHWVTRTGIQLKALGDTGYDLKFVYGRWWEIMLSACRHYQEATSS